MSATITRRTFSAGLVAAIGLTLTACGSSSGGLKEENGTTTISVGASPQPHVTILQYIKDNLLEGTGINLDIVEISDYNTPNTSLADGSLAANFFQTPNYLAQQIKDKGYDFVAIADVHIEPLGLYSSKVTSVGEIPANGTIILNNDPANTARGLKLLAQAGLITLDEAAEQPTEEDVTANPKNLTFTTVDGAQVTRSMQDADAAVVNGNFAIEAGLVPSRDALELESAQDSAYVNQLVVRTEDKDNAHLKKLAELLNHDKVRTFIEETWTDGSVLPAF